MPETEFFAQVLEKHYETVDTDVATLSADAVTSAFEHAAEVALKGPVGIDTAALQERLALCGFWVESQCPSLQTITFARQSFTADLCESITIESAGSRGNVVQVRVGAWFGRHGIVAADSRLLVELSSRAGNGAVLLRDARHAREVEERLVRIGPLQARIFARAHGEGILTRVAPARRAAAIYMTFLRPGRQPGESLAKLQARATENQRLLARRVLETPGIAHLPGDELYQLAALLIAVHGEEVEGMPHPFRTAALKGNALMMRVQLIVHHLLERSGGGLACHA